MIFFLLPDFWSYNMKKTILAAAAVALTLSLAACGPGSAKAGTLDVGVFGGAQVNGNGDAGLVIAHEFNQNLAVEGTFDHGFDATVHGKNPTGNQYSGDVVLSLPVARLTPYVLAGAGYRDPNSNAVRNEADWTVGAGVRYSLTKRISLDTRYRRVEGFQTHEDQNLLTSGFTVRF
jgi:opacity protein-like surface antigen